MVNFHSLRVAEIRRETADAVVVSFDLPDSLIEPFRFTQGQHLTLRREFDGIEERRNYSICSSVNDAVLRIAIKKITNGKFSSFANDQLAPGDYIDVMPPSGRFNTPLDPEQRCHYLAFAAGSGITPVFSIIKTTLELEPYSRFTLVYANRYTNSIILLESLEDLKDRYRERFNLINILSRERQDIELFNGRIDAEKIEQLTKTLIALETVDQCFLCGPQPMVDTISSTLQQRGFDSSRIHFELFTTPEMNLAAGQSVAEPRQLSAEEAAHRSEVLLVLDGKHTTLALRRGAESILEAALKQRPDMPYACKGGMCCTCRAKVIEGEVEMDVCYGLEDDEIEAGFVLTCQAHPVSDRVVVDYDQR